MPSQLAVSARMKATEALKSAKTRLRKGQKATCPKAKQSSIRLDARSYNVWFDRNEVSILTVDGRRRFPIIVPDYFQQYLNWRRGSADLFLRNNGVFLHIVFEKDIPDPEFTGKVIGIDRGVRKIAVTSDNRFFNGGEIRRISRRYERLRSALQSCGTKSAKRHLRKISRKENRFRRDVNHRITKQIAQSIPPGTIVVLEKLDGIRQRTRLRKRQRGELHKWNFFQFQQFLTYKSEARGIAVEYVSARYTSQKCSRCGHISRSNRQIRSVFKCRQCGFSLNADLNASRNIRQNYLDATGYLGRAHVNEPIVSPTPEGMGRDKLPALAGSG